MEKERELERVVEHNIVRLKRVGFDVEKAIKLGLPIYTFKDKRTGKYVYNFFVDKDLNPADPYDVYDKGELNKLLDKWEKERG